MQKGYGFLSAEGMRDVFCHYSSIQADGYKILKEGDPVEFDVERGTGWSFLDSQRRSTRS